MLILFQVLATDIRDKDRGFKQTGDLFLELRRRRVCKTKRPDFGSGICVMIFWGAGVARAPKEHCFFRITRILLNLSS